MPKIYSTKFKESVIRYYNSKNFTIKNTIKIFEISKSTLYNWINEYNKNNLHNIINKRYKYNKNNRKEIRNYIVKYTLKKKTKFNIIYLKKNIKKKFKRNICKSRIYIILKEEKITYKKISNKTVHKNEKIMKKKIKIFKEEILKHNPNNIISIDESSFDTNISKINGWNVKGKRIINKSKDNQRKRITLIL
jgi:transposase